MVMLSIAEVAGQASLSQKAVRAAIARGDLVASKLGGRVRIEQEEFEAWIDRARVAPHNRGTPVASLPRDRKPTGRLRSALARERSK